jgi:hypothetical protein
MCCPTSSSGILGSGLNSWSAVLAFLAESTVGITAYQQHIKLSGRMSQVFVPLSCLTVVVAVFLSLATNVAVTITVLFLGPRTQPRKRKRCRYNL